MRKIVALRGRPNSGKSRSIRKAFEKLCARYPQPTKVINRGPIGIKAVITVNGVKVGFVSTGDVSDALSRDLEELKNFGCEVIVCACRASAQKSTVTERVVSEFARNNACEVGWIDKRPAETAAAHEVSNESTADEIVAAVRMACGL